MIKTEKDLILPTLTTKKVIEIEQDPNTVFKLN